MNKFQNYFKTIVNKIEGYPLILNRYLFLFFAILAIRLCLEFFANQRLFQLEDVIHIGLWFIFIVEAFMLQLHLFSRVKMELIIKLVVCCFSIALTAPIIDLIISQGKFSKMNYLTVNSVGDFVRSYFTIGGASLSRGATIGIRIEIILLVLASFNYVYVKTSSVYRAIIGAFIIYSVLFLSGTIPYFMGKLNDIFHLTYGPEDSSSTSLLLLLDVILFILIFIRHNKNAIKFKLSFLQLIHTIVNAGLIIFGAFIARNNYSENWQLNPTTIYFFPLLVLVFLILTAIENYGIKKKENEDSKFHIQNGMLILIGLTSSCISFHTLFSALLVWAILFLLYERPLMFNTIPILSEFLKSFLSLGYFLIGFMTFGAPMISIDSFLILILLSISFSIHLVLYLINSYFSKSKLTQH